MPFHRPDSIDPLPGVRFILLPQRVGSDWPVGRFGYRPMTPLFTFNGGLAAIVTLWSLVIGIVLYLITVWHVGDG